MGQSLGYLKSSESAGVLLLGSIERKSRKAGSDESTSGTDLRSSVNCTNLTYSRPRYLLILSLIEPTKKRISCIRAELDTQTVRRPFLKSTGLECFPMDGPTISSQFLHNFHRVNCSDRGDLPFASNACRTFEAGRRRLRGFSWLIDRNRYHVSLRQ
jgi:hypothetical protein